MKDSVGSVIGVTKKRYMRKFLALEQLILVNKTSEEKRQSCFIILVANVGHPESSIFFTCNVFQDTLYFSFFGMTTV